MKYQVRVGDRVYGVEIDGGQVTVEGVAHQAELQIVPGTPLRLLRLDGAPSVLVAEPGRHGMWALEFRGERFEVEVLDERTAHIRSLVGAGTAPPGPTTLKAPMPGLVVRVQVEPGDAVIAGQALVVLEAMKMENELKAAGPGVVEEVAIQAGQAVERGQVLIRFGLPV
jgi:propionyl-CoA carboxylase alpha chain